MILLDTNVLSEVLKPVPDARVIDWLDAQDDDTWTSAISEAEMLAGVAVVPGGRRREGLIQATRAMFAKEFAGRILSFNTDSARAYADIVATRRRARPPIYQSDAMIAAMALTCSATVATRNVSDFTGLGFEVVNPWTVG